MANFNNLALTTNGINALLAAQAGTTLTLSKIGMGSGSANGSVAGLTDLATPELMMPITETNVDSASGHMTLIAKMTNEGMEEGFYWRETGLFFEDAAGNDVLFAYACITDDAYDYIPAYNDQRYVKMIRIANIVSDSANITIKDPEGLVYVDTLTFEAFKEEVKDHTENTSNPHDVTADQVGAVPSVMANNCRFVTFMGDHTYITKYLDDSVPNIPAVSNFFHIVSLDANSKVLADLALPIDYTGNVYRYSAADKKWKELARAEDFLPLTGGTLSGSLLGFFNGLGQIFVDKNTFAFRAMEVPNDGTKSNRTFAVHNAGYREDIARSAVLSDYGSDGSYAEYLLYGQHNKSLLSKDVLGVEEVQWVDELPADAASHLEIAYCILEG